MYTGSMSRGELSRRQDVGQPGRYEPAVGWQKEHVVCKGNAEMASNIVCGHPARQAILGIGTHSFQSHTNVTPP